eukprot:1157661-Pelagomonas_calceolata.AAC.1
MQVQVSSPACKPLYQHPKVGLKLQSATRVCRASTKEATKPAGAFRFIASLQHVDECTVSS